MAERACHWRLSRRAGRVRSMVWTTRLTARPIAIPRISVIQPFHEVLEIVGPSICAICDDLGGPDGTACLAGAVAAGWLAGFSWVWAQAPCANVNARKSSSKNRL